MSEYSRVGNTSLFIYFLVPGSRGTLWLGQCFPDKDATEQYKNESPSWTLGGEEYTIHEAKQEGIKKERKELLHGEYL